MYQKFLWLQYLLSQLCIFYWKILAHNPIIGSYDRIQRVLYMDLDLIKFSLNKHFNYKNKLTMPLMVLLSVMVSSVVSKDIFSYNCEGFLCP